MIIAEIQTATRDELTSTLADFVTSKLRAAVDARGSASLVVSGGSTPEPLFVALANTDLPWEKIYLTLADERWVDNKSKDSNEALLRGSLLQGFAAKANFVPLKNAAKTAGEGLHDCEAALSCIPRPFDLVVLGMGDDGHTASLFPRVSGDALDIENPQHCAAIKPTTAPYERISMTASAILSSRQIILHIVGENKWQVYQQAVLGESLDEMPVRLVLSQDKVPVGVYWSP
ncbi:MAG: 6-phosphogluconolactonase [Gammaproteobacteria bacterium]|nr:6-phosphogluconolactonase [Gammaproteobacteria bacterium]